MKYIWTHDPDQRQFDTAEACMEFFADQPVNLLNGDDGYVDEISDEEAAELLEEAA